MKYWLRIIATMALLAGVFVGATYFVNHYPEIAKVLFIIVVGGFFLLCAAFLIVGPKNKREG